LHHATTDICKTTRETRVAESVCANAARFYFGYWFSHWRA
jgi:hypothetical protein